jgi:uncharacterized protein YbjT (DUF2867 family)
MVGFDSTAGFVKIYGTGESKVSCMSSSNMADFAVNLATGDLYQKNMILELGGPEDLSQLEVVKLFESALGKQIRLDYVPVGILKEHYGSRDPLQKTFAALMLAYAAGDVVLNSVPTARRHGVHLRTLSEYAAHFQIPQAVS